MDKPVYAALDAARTDGIGCDLNYCSLCTQSTLIRLYMTLLYVKLA